MSRVLVRGHDILRALGPDAVADWDALASSSFFPAAVAEGRIVRTEQLPDDEVARGEIHQAVHAAIRELPPEYRMVLHLRDIEQLSTHEVAVALDLPEGTVKMRLHRARLMLRKTLADRIGRPAGGGRGES